MNMSLALKSAAVAVLWSAVLPAGGARPDFTGRWQLNVKESEDAHAKMIWADGSRSPRPRESPGGPRPSPGYGNRPPRGGPSGGGPQAIIEGSLPPGLRDFLEPAATLTIAGTETELTLSGDSGSTVRLVPDGREVKDGALLRVAKWEGPSLVVDSRADTGERLLTRYNMMPGTRKIEVYSMLSDKNRHTVTLRRVYDAVEPSPSPPPG
jgi:hypothetical protein